MLQVPRYISLIVAVVDASMFICSFTGPQLGSKNSALVLEIFIPSAICIEHHIYVDVDYMVFVLYFIARFHPYLEGRRSSIAGDNVRQ